MKLALSAYQVVPPAPGREAPTPRETVPAPAPPDAPPPPGGGLFGLLPLLIFIPLIFLLFWSSRSQQKKQEAAIASLKKGDRVLTQSGLVGRLVDIDQRYAKVELAAGIKVQMLRSSLLGRDTDETSGKKADSPSEKK